jgi:adenylate kinase
LDVPEHELRRRLAERGEREGRSDDDPDVIEQRFEVWAATGPELLEWYERRSLLERVNGVGSVDDVFARVVAAVERRVSTDVEPTPPDQGGAPPDR